MDEPIQPAEILGSWMYEFGSLQEAILAQLAINRTHQGKNVLTPPSQLVQPNPETTHILLRTTRIRRPYRLSWRMELSHSTSSNVMKGEMLVVLSAEDVVRLVIKRDVDTSKAAFSSLADIKDATSWSLHFNFNELSGPRELRRATLADLIATQQPKSLAQNDLVKKLRQHKERMDLEIPLRFEEALICTRALAKIYTSTPR